MSDGEEAKPNDDEIILKLDDNKAASERLGDDTQTESTNLLAGLDTQVDNQIDLLSLQKDTQNSNLVDFSTVCCCCSDIYCLINTMLYVHFPLCFLQSHQIGLKVQGKSFCSLLYSTANSSLHFPCLAVAC